MIGIGTCWRDDHKRLIFRRGDAIDYHCPECGLSWSMVRCYE